MARTAVREFRNPNREARSVLRCDGRKMSRADGLVSSVDQTSDFRIYSDFGFRVSGLISVHDQPRGPAERFAARVRDAARIEAGIFMPDKIQHQFGIGRARKISAIRLPLIRRRQGAERAQNQSHRVAG